MLPFAQVLQRGRAPRSAEILPRHRFTTAPWRFNGAALRGARRSRIRWSRAAYSGRLQRGRAPRSAEMPSGPRPRSRACWRFNGAALRGARRYVERARAGTEHLASTGPRSEERGDHAHEVIHPVAFRASTGPRSEERGDADRGPAGRGAARASTGPRSEERGDMPDKHPRRRLLPASTGPRSEERGDKAPTTSACAPSSMLQRGRAPRSAEM